MPSKSFNDLFQDAEQHEDYWVAGTVLELTEAVTEMMESAGVSRSELARRLGTSPAYVTKLLRGNTNFTLLTLHRLAKALEADLRIELVPPAESNPSIRDHRDLGRSGQSQRSQAMVAAPRQP